MGRKLTREVVREVFHRLLEGESYRSIAGELGISSTSVHNLREVLDYAIDNAGAIMYRLRKLKELDVEKKRKQKQIGIPTSLAKVSATILYAYYVYVGWRIVREVRELAKSGKLSRIEVEKRVRRLVREFTDALMQFIPWDLLRCKRVLPTDIALSPLYDTLDELELLFRSEAENMGLLVEEDREPRISLVYVVEGGELGYNYNLQLKIPITSELIEKPAKGIELIHYCAEKLFNEEVASKILSITEEYMKVYEEITKHEDDTREALRKIRDARRKAKRNIRKVIEDLVGGNIRAIYVKTPDQLSNTNRVNITIYLVSSVEEDKVNIDS